MIDEKTIRYRVGEVQKTIAGILDKYDKKLIPFDETMYHLTESHMILRHMVEDIEKCDELFANDILDKIRVTQYAETVSMLKVIKEESLRLEKIVSVNHGKFKDYVQSIISVDWENWNKKEE